jgi:hypothetical protein
LLTFQSGIPLKMPFTHPANPFLPLTGPVSAAEFAQTGHKTSDPTPQFIIQIPNKKIQSPA